MTALLLTRSPGEMRAALLDADERVVEVRHYRDTAVLPGDVYAGRAGARVPGHDAVFVDLGRGAPGWLPLGKGAKAHEGQWLPVRVVQAPQAEKGAKLRLADDVPLPEVFPRPHLLHRDAPVAALLVEFGPQLAALVCDDPRDFRQCKALCKGADLGHLKPRLHDGNTALFEAADVEEVLDGIPDPVVPLPGGGRLVIERTQALIAIDVDAGRGGGSKANRDAVAEIARQLRLRQLSGRIVVDFAGGQGRKDAMIALRDAVKGDPTSVQVAGLSPLGLVELTRNRRFAPVAETLTDAATPALAALRRVLRESRVTPSGRVGLRARAEVIATLRGPLAAALEETEQLLRCPLHLIAAPDGRTEVLTGTAVPGSDAPA